MKIEDKVCCKCFGRKLRMDMIERLATSNFTCPKCNGTGIKNELSQTQKAWEEA